MVDVPQAGGGHMPRSHMATSGNAAAAADAEEAWQRTQRLERVSARVLARAEVSAERVRELAAAAAGSWAAAAANHGDASSDATAHPDNARAQEAAPAPEAAIPKWKAISMGFGIATEISGGVKQLKQDQADFLANVTAVGGEFLTELVAELNESVATAQSEILAANVPLASYGRVKDALDRFKGTFSDRARQLLGVSMSSIRTNVSEGLKQQKAEQEAHFQRHIKDTVENINNDCSERIRAAEQNEKEAKAEVQRIMQRSSSTEEIINKVENALKVCEEKLAKATARNAKLEDKMKKEAEEWAAAVSESLDNCTLKAKKDPTVQEATTGIFKKQQRSVGEQLKRAIDHFDSYGAQLTHLLAYYEDAKKRASETRKEERDEMQAELAECGERMEKKQEEWKEQKQRLLDEIELEKKAKLDFEDQLSQMKTNAATIHKVAKDAASIDVKKLEGKLAEAQASIDTLKQQLLAKTHDLKAMENSRDAAESRVLEKEKHRQDDYAVMQAKLATCVAALNAARAAAKNGGYYFAAAPTSQHHHLDEEFMAECVSSARRRESGSPTSDIFGLRTLSGTTSPTRRPWSPPKQVTPTSDGTMRHVVVQDSRRYPSPQSALSPHASAAHSPPASELSPPKSKRSAGRKSLGSSRVGSQTGTPPASSRGATNPSRSAKKSERGDKREKREKHRDGKDIAPSSGSLVSSPLLNVQEI